MGRLGSVAVRGARGGFGGREWGGREAGRGSEVEVGRKRSLLDLGAAAEP
jgi:hypothetical protein